MGKFECKIQSEILCKFKLRKFQNGDVTCEIFRI